MIKKRKEMRQKITGCEDGEDNNEIDILMVKQTKFGILSTKFDFSIMNLG